MILSWKKVPPDSGQAFILPTKAGSPVSVGACGRRLVWLGRGKVGGSGDYRTVTVSKLKADGGHLGIFGAAAVLACRLSKEHR